MRNWDQITHVCICGSAYALLQYVLLQDEEIIKAHTYYIIGSGIKPEIAHKLPHYTQFNTIQNSGINKISRICNKLLLRWFGMIRFPFLRTAQIYAQDYLYPVVAIGKRPYIMLQESPYHMTVNYGAESQDFRRAVTHLQSLSGKIEKLLYGDVLLLPPGSTMQCQKVELTEQNDSPLLENKVCEIHSFQSLWETTSESKKEFVRALFGVSKEELVTQKCVFLTQPLVNDGILTESDYQDLLKKIFSIYEERDICIKVHPRDTYDYATHFPSIKVFNRPINLELLFLLDWKCTRVISICSTAVNSVPENIEVDWLGTEIHPKLTTYFGNTIVPYRKYNIIDIK